jgi:Glycosyltransferase family 92
VGPLLFKNQDGFAFTQWLVYHLEVLGIDHVVLYLVQSARIPVAAVKVMQHYHGEGRLTVIDWAPLGDAWAKHSWCYMQVCSPPPA